ncbi:MAG: type II toxin-antitoxin system VapC family toxin [Thermoplasmata archaeon]|nr:type II toxin-antitoxin system VapC family toxin [Thermoplasmata archaeon]
MIFVDTSAWVALSDPSDENHREAVKANAELRRGSHGRLVTSSFVLDETFTILRDRVGLSRVRLLAERLLESPNVHVFWVEEPRFREALHLMFSHADKHWSVTDCTSFVAMRAMEIQQAFTFDRDFVQAGFHALP